MKMRLRARGAPDSVPEQRLPSSLSLFDRIVITKRKKKFSLSLPPRLPVGTLAYFRGTLTSALQTSVFFLCARLKKMKSAVDLCYSS